MLSTLASRIPRCGRAAVSAALLSGLAACAPQFETKDGAQIRCTTSDDCPPDAYCAAIHLCVKSSGDTIPPLVTKVEFLKDAEGLGDFQPSTPELTSLGPAAGFALALETDEPLLTAPKVTLGRGGTALRFLGVFERGTLRFNYVLGGEDADAGMGTGGKGGEVGRPKEGVYEVWASLVDASGNLAETRLGTVDFDSTHPRVLADTVSVALLPGPANPLREVAKATVDTRVQIAFTLSERLPEGSRPRVWTDLGVDGGGELDFQYASSEGNSWVYQVDFKRTAALEMCPRVLVQAVDAAGNGLNPDDKGGDFPVVVVPEPDAAGLLPHLCFDTVAPVAPDADGSRLPQGCGPGAGLTYRRMPYGRSGEGADFRVYGSDCSMEAGETVIAYDRGTRASAAELGRGRSTGEGALDLPLSLGDRERVYVAAADEAGNLSELRLVEDVEWIATLGGKVAGSRLQNPSIFSATALLLPTLSQDPSLSAEVGNAELPSLSESDAAAFTKAGEQAWRLRSHPGDGPVPRGATAAAFDSWRGRLVLFAGYAADARLLQDSWEYAPDVGAWVDRTPAGTRPPARRGHAAVFDGRRGKVVVYGGTGQSVDPAASDCSVWEWDGGTGLWRERPLECEDGPGVRIGHAMAYDPSSGKVLLFGGRLYSLGNVQDRNDVWTWDPATGTWTPITSASGGPPSIRHSAAAAYDPVTRRVYVHGGASDDARYQDLWELDPATFSWTQLADSSGPRAGHRMLAIPEDWTKTTPRLLVFGGGDTPTTSSDAAWLYADGAWKDVTAKASPPAAREGFAAGFDPVSRRVVVFGGVKVEPGPPGSTKPVETLWGDTLDASLDDARVADWTVRSPRHEDPPARSGHLLAPAAQGSVVLFGGEDAGGLRDDTWLWDARSGAWREASAGTKPMARSGSAVAARPSATEPSSSVVYAFGGRGSGGALDDLWTYEASKGWSPILKGVPWPQAREGAAMVWDSRGSGQWVLFGGRSGDTWHTETWTSPNGSAWTRHEAGAGPWPSPREGASMAALPNGKVVMFGGRKAEGTTGAFAYDDALWEWDGSTWIRRGAGPDVGGSVQTRAGATLLPSLERGRLLLFGGEKSSAMQSPWELEPTAASWAERAAYATPPPRARHAMASLGIRALLFGGSNGGKHLSDTWEWDPASGGQPAAIWRVPLPAAQSYAKASVRAFAGGRGQLGGGLDIDGAQLLRWDVRSDSWKGLAQNGAPASPVALLTGELAGDADVRQSLVGDERELCLVIRPVGTNLAAAQMAEVGVDYMELTVRYLAAAEP